MTCNKDRQAANGTTLRPSVEPTGAQCDASRGRVDEKLTAATNRQSNRIGRSAAGVSLASRVAVVAATKPQVRDGNPPTGAGGKRQT